MAVSSTPQAPPAPDPYRTASAEGRSNTQTAIANSVLSNPNTYSPYGSTTYEQSGEMQTITLPDGSTTQVPRYNQRMTLSPEQQRLYDLNTQTQQQIGQIGLDQSRRIGDILGKPVDYSDLKIDPNSFSADRTRVEDALRARLQPQNDLAYNALENRLTNQGFQRGTEAFRSAMDEYQRGINDQNLAITGQGLAEQQGLYGMARDAAGYEMQRRTQQQNQPINAITALLSGSQVSMPSVAGYNAPTIAGTNIGQNVYNSAALQNQQYQQQMGQQNAMMGGLFGLGSAAALGGMKYAPQIAQGVSTLAPLFMSDRRLKRDIQDTGSELNGHKLYSYKYVWGDEPQIGVMADEVLRVKPEAVHVIDGYMAVDYGAL